ncbi:MAG: hypothetical protein H0U59_04705 [Gemmatimonadaceae bacterium]|nr:hypothetical protein [Gemmatimonadaceae bacterium]
MTKYETELRKAGKTRNTIATYVQHPERFINWLVGSYKPTPSSAETGGRTSRYDPLRVFLEEKDEPVVRLTFSQIERILGRPLPASARKYAPWWANEREGTHVHARAWMAVGRRSRKVDLIAGTIELAR